MDYEAEYEGYGSISYVKSFYTFHGVQAVRSRNQAIRARFTFSHGKHGVLTCGWGHRRKADIYAGIAGNEKADRMAKLRAYGGRVMQIEQKITPAGIRQDFPIHQKPKHLS